MVFSKLFKAASLIQHSRPDLSSELTKIAQDLSQSIANNSTENLGLNPNIKNFANPSTQSAQKKTHKITFTVDVPPSWGELEIMNKLLPVLKQMDATEKDLEIKGYQFTQS